MAILAKAVIGCTYLDIGRYRYGYSGKALDKPSIAAGQSTPTFLLKCNCLLLYF